MTRFVDDAGTERARPLAVVPAFSVALEPGTQVISTHNGSEFDGDGGRNQQSEPR